MDVAELPECDVELGLQIGNAAKLRVGLGPEPLDGVLQLRDDGARGFESPSKTVLVWRSLLAFLAAIALWSYWSGFPSWSP